MALYSLLSIWYNYSKITTPLPFSSELISSCDVCCKKDMASSMSFMQLK